MRAPQARADSSENGTEPAPAGQNGLGTEAGRYLAAAHLDAIPYDRLTPRLPAADPAMRAAGQARVALATRIWCAGATDAERRELLASCDADPAVLGPVRRNLQRHLRGPANRLPPGPIETACRELGIENAHNPLLSAAERKALDEDGYVNLGPLLSPAQLDAMRRRFGDSALQEGSAAGHEVSQTRGIARLSGTVIKAMNRDGLLDPFAFHPKLLAAVRHVLGPRFRYSSSNFHCPLPGYGHQAIHADWGWGVRDPEVVNAIWLLDDFTAENGPTRVVPGSHRWREHPMGSTIDGVPRDLTAPVPGEVHLTGAAGSCIAYNAHLWHSGTQNFSPDLRRAQHAFFTRTVRPTQTDVPALLDGAVFERLNPVARAVLDVG